MSPRSRGDTWDPRDDYDPDDIDLDDPDNDADPGRHWCTTCGRSTEDATVCQGPGPYPRPCIAGLPMPRRTP